MEIILKNEVLYWFINEYACGRHWINYSITVTLTFNRKEPLRPVKHSCNWSKKTNSLGFLGVIWGKNCKNEFCKIIRQQKFSKTKTWKICPNVNRNFDLISKFFINWWERFWNKKIFLKDYRLSETRSFI